MKKIKTPTPTTALPQFTLARFLKLWPGLIALVSLLALWGESAVHPERGPRPLLSAGQVALPELRAVPVPVPVPGLVGSPDAAPSAALSVPGSQAGPVLGQAQRGAPYPDLKVLGRFQTDGA